MLRFRWVAAWVCLVVVPMAFGGEMEDRIRSGMEVVAKATIGGDHAAVADRTYPGVIEMAGGKDRMIEMMASMIGEMSDNGMSFKSMDVLSIGTPVKAGEQMHALVKTKMIMGVPGGSLENIGYTIAISDDQGANWSFLNVSPGLRQQMEQILPGFSLEVPAAPEPNYLPD